MKGWKSLGNKLTYDTLKSFEDITPEPVIEEEEIPLIIEPSDDDVVKELSKNNEKPNDDGEDDDEANQVKTIQINLF